MARPSAGIAETPQARENDFSRRLLPHRSSLRAFEVQPRTGFARRLGTHKMKMLLHAYVKRMMILH